MSAGLLSTGATPTAFRFAMGEDLGRAIVIESTGPGHVAELLPWDDELDSLDDVELGWSIGADLRYEESVGAVAALSERFHAWRHEHERWPR